MDRNFDDIYILKYVNPNNHEAFYYKVSGEWEFKIRYNGIGYFSELNIGKGDFVLTNFVQSSPEEFLKCNPSCKLESTCDMCAEVWNYDRFYIHEGYHSYLTEEMAKGRMYSAEIGIFEIPVGATVYINYAHREVVSTDIKYLGLLEE